MLIVLLKMPRRGGRKKKAEEQRYAKIDFRFGSNPTLPRLFLAGGETNPNTNNRKIRTQPKSKLHELFSWQGGFS